MSENIMTSAELIRFFEREIIQREQGSFDFKAGNRPYAPVLVAYLGDADRQHDKLERAVFRLWPQFRREIRFLALGGDDDYYSLPAEGDGEKAELTEKQVSETITSLFVEGKHFENHEYLNVYYVMQTDDFSDIAEYDRWVERIRRLPRLLGDIEVRTILVVLLNEDFVGCHRSVAQEIRKRLGAYCGGEASPLEANNVYLLSNRKSDNRFLQSWDVCIRIIASIMAISNSRDIRVGQNEDRQVYTIGYAREEKPLHDIGQVVVRQVIDELTDMMRIVDFRIDSDTLKKLGITEGGTLRLLDKEAEEIDLPEPEIFPRRDNLDQDVRALSGDEFDELTMGSWRMYLEQLLENERKSAHSDANSNKLRSEFERALEDAFGIGELLRLSQFDMTIREKIHPKAPSQTGNVLSDAREYLKYSFSSDERLVELFLQAIEKLGAEAKLARESWNHLVESKNYDFFDPENSVSEFYSHVCRNYFNKHGDALRKRAREVHTLAEQQKLLQDVISDIIESDDIFEAGFEEELKARMDFSGKELNTREYVQSRLTGDSVKIYLRLAFALDAPRHSIVLMNTETELKKELAKTLRDISDSSAAALDGKYLYYNTGSSAAAETLKIIPVSSSQLM